MTDIYYGPRDEKFKCVIESVLNLGKLKRHYIDLLLSDESMEMYSKAFTHKSADPKNNYEYLEFLGDATLKKNIPWYLNDRFPFLRCEEGVVIITRVKINLEQKDSFFNIATELGFWKYVSASEDIRTREMKKTLEDVFEAFFGVTEMMLDKFTRQGVGSQICYNIIKTILDGKEISLKYESLFDAKTRLKETFDYLNKQYPNTFSRDVNYEYTKEPNPNDNRFTIFVTSVYTNQGQNKKLIGKGSASNLDDSKQNAAENAYQYLKKQNLIKPVPKIYSDIENICKF